jgi:hypothetical protein
MNERVGYKRESCQRPGQERSRYQATKILVEVIFKRSFYTKPTEIVIFLLQDIDRLYEYLTARVVFVFNIDP